MCVQRFDDSQFCISHYVSHFAAFFIVARAKISVAESCHSVTFFDQGGEIGRDTRASALSLVPSVASSVKRMNQSMVWFFVSGFESRTQARVQDRSNHATTGRCKFTEFLIVVKNKRGNDPSAGSPTETLLRLHLPLDGKV